MDKIYVTKEGYESLKAELRYLIDVERPQVLQEIKEARAQGDLSENADYDAARDKQAVIEAKITELTEMIENFTEIVQSSETETEALDKIRELVLNHMHMVVDR